MFDAAGVATGAEVAEQSASDAEASAQADHDSVDPVTPSAPASEPREVYFIDASVTDAQTLIDGLPEGAEVVLLNGPEDGFSQMADYLSGQQGIDAIHIISHGSDGNLHAGSTALNAGNMEAYSTVLRSIGQSLTAEGDILLYGCDIGMGEVGQAFVSELAQLTGADVAASDDTTGLNGDWELEIASGSIEASVGVSAAAQTAYQYDLGTFDFDSEPSNVNQSSISVTNSGVTLTASAGDSVISIENQMYDSALNNFVGNVLVTGDLITGANQIVLSFDKPVTISQLLVTAITPDGENKVTSNLTFTPDTGSAYTTAVDGNSATTLSGFNGISTLTITSSASDVDFAVDDIIFAESPSISSATYDASTGDLVVTGTNFTALSGAANDIDASDLTIVGEGGDTYTLTDTADVEINSDTQFTLTLSATDKAAIDQIFNGNGTSSTGGTAYNLAGAAGFVANDSSTSDTTGNGITVSNVATPTITSATYDHSTNVLTVTGSGFVKSAGAANDVDVSALTITGNSGNTYTLTDSTDVEIIDSTRFAVTLSSGDALSVEGLLNSDGTSSDDSYTYNLAAADNWMAGATAAIDIADGSNAMTVFNVTAPTITSATYDASTNVLTVTGSNLVKASGANNDVTVSTLTLTGEGGATYTLSSSSNVEITNSNTFSITLTGADVPAVEALLNTNGTSSADSTVYNLSAADNWMPAAAASTNIADTSGNAITVSNVAAPTITSANYDASTNTLVLTGANFVSSSGANNDIDVGRLTIYGEGGYSYGLPGTNDVEITSATSATITLSDSAARYIEGLLNKDGTTSDDGTTYNIAASDNWMRGAPDAVDISDASTPINVSNLSVPTATSATYDASTGVVVVTGTDLVSNLDGSRDVDLTKITFTGDGGNTYTVTSTDGVNLTSNTSFSFTLSESDRLTINGLLNANGTQSGDSTNYNISFADNWLTGAANSTDISDLSSNPVTVSGVSAPTVTAATYDATTGQLTLTGADFVAAMGPNNDIVAGQLTFTGEGGATFTLTDTPNAEVTSATTAVLTLSAADQASISALLNANGTTSSDNTTYNLSIADNWMPAANAAADISDLSNPVTVSNVVASTESGSGNDIALNSSQNGQQTAFQPNSTVTPVAVTYTPISVANPQPRDIAGINSVTTASIMSTGTKTVSAENFGNPAAGVDEISIIRNVVTHNDGVLNSFYGSTQVASEGAGRVADTSANLSRLANSLGGGLGGSAAGGEFATLVDGFLTAEAEDNNGNDVLPLEMYALNNAGFSAELARAAGMKETNLLAALINDA